jgi:hypothetical protein
MGLLQHRHFKKRGDKSIFAYLHRRIGRGAIVLGITDRGLGFQLAEINVIVSAGWYIWRYVLLGFFVFIWFTLVLNDEFKMHRPSTVTERGARGRVNE